MQFSMNVVIIQTRTSPSNSVQYLLKRSLISAFFQKIMSKSNALTVTLADENSSIYAELLRQLLDCPNWNDSSNSNRFKCDLYLGERNNLPFSQLSIFVNNKKLLVNYYRGSNVICKKCQLVRSLRFFKLDKSNWLPTSFIVSPGRANCDDRSDLQLFMSQGSRACIVKVNDLWLLLKKL